MPDSLSRNEHQPEVLTPTRCHSWLLVALVITPIVAFIGSMLMLSMFGAETESVAAYTGVDDGTALTVVVGRTPGGPSQWELYVSVFRELQEALGMPVRIRYVPDRSGVVEAVRSPSVDLAFVSIYQSLVLCEDGQFELFANPVIEGAETETGVIVVRQDSTFRSLDDLRGTTLAIGKSCSLAGCAYVDWLLAQKCTTRDEFFGSVLVEAEHNYNLRLVANGEADVTAVNCSQLASWPTNVFRVIDRSPDIGMPPMIVRSSMSSELREPMLDALFSLRPGSGLPPDSSLAGFRPATPDEYVFAKLLFEYTNVTGRGESALVGR